MHSTQFTVQVKSDSQLFHWHETVEIDFVLQGQIDVTLNNRMRMVQAGDMIVINMGDIHSIQAASEETIYIQMQIEVAEFDRYLPGISSMNFYCGPETKDAVSLELKKEMRGAVARIACIMDKRAAGSSDESEMLYCCIEILSNLKLGFQGGDLSNEKLDLDEERSARIWKVIDYMYDNYDRKLPLQEVADAVYLSGAHLSRMMRKYIGLSYEEFLAFVRCESSLPLLLSTSKSITDIAYECGFSAPRYYTKSFVRFYECAPGEYREQNKAQFHQEKPQHTEGLLLDDLVDQRAFRELAEKFQKVSAESVEPQIIIELDLNSETDFHPADLSNQTAVQKTGLDKMDPFGFVLPNGINTEGYYLAEAVSHSAGIGVMRQPKLLTAKTGDAWQIMIYSTNEGLRGGRLILHGLDPDAEYLLTIQQPARIREDVCEAANKLSAQTVFADDKLKNMFKPSVIHQILRHQSSIEEPFTLGKNQFKELKLRKV